MEKYLAMVKKFECDSFVPSEKQTEECDCVHDFRDGNGCSVCIKCGIMDDSFDEYVGECFEDRFACAQSRPYTKYKNLQNWITKINLQCCLSGVELELPTELTEIRKFIRKHKLNPKDDIRYWMSKNGIRTRISTGEANDWISEYRKMGSRSMSAKDFLYQKFSTIRKFKRLIPLAQRKA